MRLPRTPLTVPKAPAILASFAASSENNSMGLRLRVAPALSLCLLVLCSAANLCAHPPHIVILPGEYLNFVVPPGARPSFRMVTLVNGTHGHMPWTASASTASGGSWLTVVPGFGDLPGESFYESATLTISAVAGSLAPGVYYGTIAISAPGIAGDPLSLPADNTPLIIEVGLTVTTTGQAAPGIGLSQKSLAFTGGAGTGRSYSSTIQVSNAGGGALNWSLSTDAASNGWLTAKQIDGKSFSVTATVGSLATGTYAGTVTVTAPGAANSPKAIPVTFTIRDPLPPNLQLGASSLKFEIIKGEPDPAPQQFTIDNAGDFNLAWHADASTFTGGGWLAIAPSSGSNSGILTVKPAAALLSPGAYTGRITISAPGAVDAPGQVQVTFIVDPPRPVFSTQSVVNGATFLGGAIAPGEILSIFGINLGPTPALVATLDPITSKLPTTLGPTTITFNGVPAPLFYASASQVNLQVPFEVASQGSAQIVANVAGLDPAALTVPVTAASLGIFTTNGTRAAALNQDFTLNTPDNRAVIGSVIHLYVTGQGLLSTPVATGSPAPLTPPFPAPLQQPVGVTMNGIQANVLFAGLAPGFVGLTQIDAEIPRALTPSDNVSVTVGIGFNQTPAPALIAVR